MGGVGLAGKNNGVKRVNSWADICLKREREQERERRMRNEVGEQWKGVTALVALGHLKGPAGMHSLTLRI